MKLHFSGRNSGHKSSVLDKVRGIGFKLAPVLLTTIMAGCAATKPNLSVKNRGNVRTEIDVWGFMGMDYKSMAWRTALDMALPSADNFTKISCEFDRPMRGSYSPVEVVFILRSIDFGCNQDGHCTGPAPTEYRVVPAPRKELSVSDGRFEKVRTIEFAPYVDEATMRPAVSITYSEAFYDTFFPLRLSFDDWSDKINLVCVDRRSLARR